MLLKVYWQPMRRRLWLRRPAQGILLLVYIAGVKVLKLWQHLVVRVQRPVRRLVERLESSRVQSELLLEDRRGGLLHDARAGVGRCFSPSRIRGGGRSTACPDSRLTAWRR